MVLHLDSNASYLSPSKARSKIGGNCYLNDLSQNPTKEPTIPLKPNGPGFPVCHILRHIMVSAAGVEILALFKNGQDAVLLRNTSVNLGHPQLPTLIKTDISTSANIANNTILQRKSRAMDMKFHCVRDRVKQGHFIVYRRPGTVNLGDYHTKYISSSHHTKVRSNYTHDLPQHLNNIMRECVIMTKKASALNVLAKVNNNLRRNIEFHTNTET